MTRSSLTFAAVLVAGTVGVAGAQPAPLRAQDQDQLRRQIYLMEGALARAVTAGAARLNQAFRELMPDTVVVAGESTARGFHLEHYGVFFDVEVPVLRQSMMWSLRTMLDQDDQGASEAIASLRAIVASTSGADRARADAALQRLEAQVRPFGVPRRPWGSGTTVSTPGSARPAQPVAGAERPALNRSLVEDPNKAYTDAVVDALVEAMIDFSLPMVSLLRPDNYLTVAARDNERRDLFAPANSYEQVSTFTLRIKASDLAAYRAGKIDVVEAKKRVEITEF